MKKRILALLLAVVMIAGMIPTIAAVNPVPAMVIRPDTSRATYTFYAGGTEVDKQIVKNGEKLTEPAAPDGEGKFLGWYVEGETDPLDFTQAVTVSETGTVKVFAHFDEVQYVLFMDENKERVVDCKTLREGDTVQTSDVTYPVGADQSVTRWNDADGVAVDKVTYGDEIDVLYAVVENGHWLTFDTDGGSYLAPQFFTTAPTAPENPTKPGYTFGNWYLDASRMDPADFSKITGTRTVYADWIPEGNVQYTVLHMQENANDDGYSTKDIETKSGQAGFSTNARAMSYPGFKAPAIEQQTIKGDGSTIVKVYYEREEYEVKFFYSENRKWNEYTDIRIKAKYGAYIGDKWPTKNGSSTWSTTSDRDIFGNLKGPFQVNIETMPLNGAKFYGPLTGSGSETAYYYVEILPGETAALTQNGVQYRLHHKDTSPGKGYDVTQNDKYDITGFTYKEGTRNGASYNNAKFFYTRNTYQLQFISGGQNVKTENVKFEADLSGYASYAPTTPPAGMDGYVFNGWYDNEQGEGDAYDFNGKTMPAQNITLFAKWVAPVHTVTFWQGDTKLDEIKDIVHGSKITEDQAPKVTVGDGEEFYGWTLEGTPFNFNTAITKDYKLDAKVGSKEGYKLTYSVNGDETLVRDDYHYAKDTDAVIMNCPASAAPADKVFLGWDTSAGTTVVYKPGETIKMTADTPLYAVFGPKTGTVSLTYHSNFGTGETQTVAGIANNGLITVSDYDDLSKLPTREGYSFRGWNTEADGTGYSYAAGASAVIDNVNAATENHLYAVWQINQCDYTIEYYFDNVIDSSLTVTDTADFGAVIDSYPNKCPNGYKLDKTENLPLTIGTDESANVIKVYYVKNTFVLRIQYLYEGAGEAAEDYTATLAEGETYSVTSPEVEGYVPDRTVVSGEMPGYARTELVTYTKRTDLSYTVNYYWNGTTEEVAASKTVSGQTDPC